MSVTVELPAETERRLRAEIPNLEAEAKEAVLVELYRQGRLTHFEFSEGLGIDRFEADAVLKKHRVDVDLPTTLEVEDDLRHLRNEAQR